jgi:hypothetical protein
MTAAHGPYASWASWLDAFGRGEDLRSEHLVTLDERVGPHMQQRLLQRVAAAFEARAQLWADRLRRRLGAGALRSHAELAYALVNARGGLAPLLRLADDARLPEPVRTELRAALRTMVDNAQRSLEDSVRVGQGGSEPLVAVIRENSLVAALTARPAPTGGRPAADPPAVTGRHLIL